MSPFSQPVDTSTTSSIPELDIRQDQDQPQTFGGEVPIRKRQDVFTLDTAPLAATGNLPNTQSFGGPFQQFVQQKEDELNIEKLALQSPDLSRYPDAFQNQQRRVDVMQGSVDLAKAQLARNQEANINSAMQASLRPKRKALGLTALDSQNIRESLGLKNSNLIYEGQDPKIAKDIVSSVMSQSSNALSFMTKVESDPIVKTHKTMKRSFDAMKSLVGKNPKNMTPQDEVSLIFQYMRINDPNSTVREGEFATAENTAGVDDRVRNMYNKILKGDRLTAKQVNNFLKSAKKMTLSSQKEYNSRLSQYRGTAKSLGIPNSVVMGISQVEDGINIKKYPIRYRKEISKILPLIGSRDSKGRLVTRERALRIINQRYGKNGAR